MTEMNRQEIKRESILQISSFCNIWPQFSFGIKWTCRYIVTWEYTDIFRCQKLIKIGEMRRTNVVANCVDAYVNKHKNALPQDVKIIKW